MGKTVARRIAAPLAIALLVACSSGPERLARHLGSAEEYLAEEKYPEALLELRSALQIDPKNAEVNVRIADTLVKQGRPADAVFYYREASRLDPTRSDAALGEAKLVLFDDTDRAEELVAAVIEREPTNVMAQVRRSEIALARNDADAALASALTAVELDPNDPMGHMQVGITRLALIRREGLEGKTPADELYQAAADAIGKADELLKGGWKARIELAKLYAAWPEHDAQAKQRYEAAIEVAPEGVPRGRAAGMAAEWARSSGDQEFLAASLEQVVLAAPENVDAWYELAELAERREKGSGEAVFKRLLEKRLQDVWARVAFARFLARQDRLDDAVAHLEATASEGLEPAVALDQVVALHLRSRQVERAKAVVDRMGRELAGEARTLLARGRLALREGRIDEAAEFLRQYVSREDNVEGHELLARAEMSRNNFPAAAAAVDEAIGRSGARPSAPLLRLKLAIHAAAGDWPMALASLRRLGNAGYPLRGTDQIVQVRALYATGRPAQGRMILEQMIAGDEAPVGALVEYASREGASNPEKARECVERVLAKSPNHAGALQLYALQELQAGRPEGALARLDRAAESSPLPPQLLLLRARIRASRQDYGPAEEDARRAFAAAPNLTGALDLLAGIYTVQGRVEEAIASFEEAERAGALPPSGMTLLARLKFATGKNDEAQALYEKALASRADLAGAKNDLAWILAVKSVELERALQLAQEAQQAEPENPSIADTLGFVYYRKGLHEAALDQFRFAIELADRARESRPEFHYHMGLALRALDRNADAAAAIEKALGLGAFPEAEQARRELEAARASAAQPG